MRCSSDCTWDYSDCEKCGDGNVDFAEGEECDKADIGGLASTQPCAGTNVGGAGEVTPLAPPNPNLPYSFGETSTCADTCRWVRLGCSYCNNGRRDGPTPIDIEGNLSLEEHRLLENTLTELRFRYVQAVGEINKAAVSPSS